MKCWIGLVFVLAAFGQQREIGAGIGYGFYRNGSIYSAGGSAQAGIRNRFAAGIDLAPHNTARGIFEQFTPLFGVSYTF